MLGQILFITSRFGGLPQGMTNSLKRMNVTYMETPIWNMQEAYDKFQPSVTIFFHHFLKEFDEYAAQVQELGGHKIYWDWECPWEINYIIKYHHLFGFILVQDKISAEYLQGRMGSKVKFVPHAADPETCKPELVPFEYRSDLCFIGAAYPSRLKFFREVLPFLEDYKVVIGGTGWEFLPSTFGQKIINSGVGGDYAKWVNGAKINVNLHRGGQEVPIANSEKVGASSPNNRFFELNMSGALQLVDDLRAPEVFEYFPESQVFHNPQEFLELFRNWVDLNQPRREFAEKQRQIALTKHTYENRFIELIAPLI